MRAGVLMFLVASIVACGATDEDNGAHASDAGTDPIDDTPPMPVDALLAFDAQFGDFEPGCSSMPRCADCVSCQAMSSCLGISAGQGNPCELPGPPIPP